MKEFSHERLVWESQAPWRSWVVTRQLRSHVEAGLKAEYTLSVGDVLAFPSLSSFERPPQYTPSDDPLEPYDRQYANFKVKERQYWEDLEEKWLIVEPDVVADTQDRLVELLGEAVSKLAMALEDTHEHRALLQCAAKGLDDGTDPEQRIDALITCLESPYAMFRCGASDPGSPR